MDRDQGAIDSQTIQTFTPSLQPNYTTSHILSSHTPSNASTLGSVAHYHGKMMALSLTKRFKVKDKREA